MQTLNLEKGIIINRGTKPKTESTGSWLVTHWQKLLLLRRIMVEGAGRLCFARFTKYLLRSNLERAVWIHSIFDISNQYPSDAIRGHFDRYSVPGTCTIVQGLRSAGG